MEFAKNKYTEDEMLKGRFLRSKGWEVKIVA